MPAPGKVEVGLVEVNLGLGADLVVLAKPPYAGLAAMLLVPLPPRGEWMRHAAGVLSDQAAPPPASLEQWPPEGAEPIDTSYLYDLLAEAGLEYGPSFRGLRAAWRDGEAICAEVSLPEGASQQAERFGLHPALLDAALHAIALLAPEGTSGARLPFSWRGMHLRLAGAGAGRPQPGGSAEP